jgi:membrane-associated protease RseP (regulator of RpoE activity)
MFRRLCVTVPAFLFAFGFCVFESSHADAQLLRRIRDRVQTRVPLPQFNPPTQVQRVPVPARPSRPDVAPVGASRAELQRVSPVAAASASQPGSTGPTLSAPNLATPRSGLKTPTAVVPQLNPIPANSVPRAVPPLASPAVPAVDAKKFGGSILAGPTVAPATSVEPTAPEESLVAESEPTMPTDQPATSVSADSDNGRNLDTTPLPSSVAETQPTVAEPQPTVAQPTTAETAESSANGPELDPTRLPNSVPTESATATVANAPIPSSGTPKTLGIDVLPTKQGVPGVQVVRFRPGSKCELAGLRVGDVIIAVNGHATPTAAEIQKQILLNEGEQVRARIVRGLSTEALMLPLVSREPSVQTADHPPVELGLVVEEKRGVRGVVVRQVSENSPAAAAGLQAGDRVVSVDGKVLISQVSFDYAIREFKAGDQVAIQVVREGKLVSADVTLAKPTATSSEVAATEPGATEPSPSVLGSVGSMIGDLLGSATDPAAEDAAVKPATEDEMDLGDDEPVVPATFESEIQRELKSLEADPPSLDSIPVPAGELDEATTAENPDNEASEIEALQAEIQRLKERLQEIEAEKE